MEEELLGNILDGLDRLYDGKLLVRDLWALVFATSEALRGTEHRAELYKAASALKEIASSGRMDQDVRELALVATNDLRLHLSREL